LEEIASNGYIVFTIYQDDKNNLPPGPLERRKSDIWLLMTQLSQLNAKDKTYFEIGGKLNTNLLYHTMDLENNIGILGHSFGGTTGSKCSYFIH
jgi:hypothetical protein